MRQVLADVVKLLVSIVSQGRSMFFEVGSTLQAVKTRREWPMWNQSLLTNHYLPLLFCVVKYRIRWTLVFVDNIASYVKSNGPIYNMCIKLNKFIIVLNKLYVFAYCCLNCLLIPCFVYLYRYVCDFSTNPSTSWWVCSIFQKNLESPFYVERIHIEN